MLQKMKRKLEILFICDGYRAHLRFSAVNIFYKGSILNAEFPFTQVVRQPLDVNMFCLFKSYLNVAISADRRAVEKVVFDMYDLLHINTNAYRKCSCC